MSLLDYIPFIGTDDDAQNTNVAVLSDLLREREETLALTAEFHEPTANVQDEPTAVFPYTLVDQYGDKYGNGAKEFRIPENGLNDAEGSVTQFLAGVTGKPVGDITRSDLLAVEGESADAHINNSGDVIVDMPQTTTEDDEEGEE